MNEQAALFDAPKKPCALTTCSASGVFWAECACGWKGPERESGPAAAGTWMKHAGGVN